MYEPRTYRSYTQSDDLVSFRVTVEETDLFVSCDKDLSREAEVSVLGLRQELEDYIKLHPGFKAAIEPLDSKASAPGIVKGMADAAKKTGVGPMAAVAGAFAERVGKDLLKQSSQVIVENGGDIFISSERPRLIGVYAGKSKFSEKIALNISPKDTPCGVCTSSATVGHSLSFGRADAAVVVSSSTLLADAAATSICNRVKEEGDIDKAINYAKGIDGIKGVFIIFDNTFGAWGRIKLVDI
ncbi:MAG: UPF0280 family protein [Candidatus Omnitrophica bacterium]|nr:UPF0280 family protein [Candidatus Omnitrophota bacterium]